jgi:chromatin remodeling complex protein RSC6
LRSSFHWYFTHYQKRTNHHGNCEESPCEEGRSGQESRPRRQESRSGQEGRSTGEKSSRQGAGQEGCSTGQKSSCQEGSCQAHTERCTLHHESHDASDDALAAIIGKGPYPRTEVTKKIWEYIKKNKLQDAANKRMINADAKLKEIFKKAQASMFEMTKMISAHLK